MGCTQPCPPSTPPCVCVCACSTPHASAEGEAGVRAGTPRCMHPRCMPRTPGQPPHPPHSASSRVPGAAQSRAPQPSRPPACHPGDSSRPPAPLAACPGTTAGVVVGVVGAGVSGVPATAGWVSGGVWGVACGLWPPPRCGSWRGSGCSGSRTRAHLQPSPVLAGNAVGGDWAWTEDQQVLRRLAARVVEHGGGWGSSSWRGWGLGHLQGGRGRGLLLLRHA